MPIFSYVNLFFVANHASSNAYKFFAFLKINSFNALSISPFLLMRSAGQ